MSEFLKVLKKNAMLVILVLVYVFFCIITKGGIFVPLRFVFLIEENAYVFILATGMLMCMLTGGNIDLSCGSFVCLAAAIGGLCLNNFGCSPFVTILVMIATGVVYGCVLGFLVAVVNVPPWIATLAGFLAFRGLGTYILTTYGKNLTLAFPEEFRKIFKGTLLQGTPGNMNVAVIIIGLVASVAVIALLSMSRMKKKKKGYEVEAYYMTLLKMIIITAVIMLFAYKYAMYGGIPVTIVWVIGIVLIYGFITSKTTTGRYFYTIGGNAEATRLSGINTKKIMFLAYLNMAVITVFATFFVASKIQVANSELGRNYEMDAIAACVVGGVSAYGGSGTVLGMVIGATLIGVINQGLTIIGLDSDWQKVIKGLVILGAVVFDIMANRKNSSTK